MTLSQDAARNVAGDLLSVHAQDTELLTQIDGWLRFEPGRIVTKASSDPEISYLKKLSNAPWARLVIESTAQALTLEGIYGADSRPEDHEQSWAVWERNRMGSRQGSLWRAALGYGYAYGVALPQWDSHLEPTARAVMTPVSPRQMIAEFGDVVEDEFPLFALRVIPQPGGARNLRLIDETHVHYLSQDDATSSIKWIDSRAHDVGYTPVVRFANQLDLEGRAPGEIQPLIPLLARINKTDYDRMLVQHYNSWKVRYAIGIDKAKNREEDERRKKRLQQADILTGGPDVKFGTLDETSMDPFVKAHDSDVEALAATSQTPATAFGKLINVSAEGLQEARASLRAKIRDRKSAFGDGAVRWLRVCADIEGRTDDAQDFTIKAKWADDDVTYLSSAVDALGKAASMLGVPPRLLWERIPNIDATTAASWRTYADKNPSPEERETQAMIDALKSNEG